MLWDLLSYIFDRAASVAEAYTRTENLSNQIDALAIFCALSPLLIVIGFLGGRVGGSLRNDSEKRIVG